MLTPKQEKFAQCVAEGMTQADAYRASYNCKPETKPESIINKASELMRNGYISSRVAELRIPIVKKVGITLEGHLADLLMLRNAALNGEQYSAAISAEIARGKASGVAVDKITADVNASVAHSIEIRIVKNNS
jgi:phage terminase small subunit